MSSIKIGNTHILEVSLGKSKSQYYENSVEIMKGLPNYKYELGIHKVFINDIKEFIDHKESIDYLINKTVNWRSCNITMFGEILNSTYYANLLEKYAGAYWELFKQDSHISYEQLPLPFVHYPNNGAFLGFSEDIDSEIYFCECQKEAIHNYVSLRSVPSNIKFEGPRAYPLGEEAFPPDISEYSQYWSSNTIDYIKFKKDICFRCNNTIPERNFCGNGVFMNKYGWYVKAEYYRLGIDTYRHTVLPNHCQHSIYTQMKSYYDELNSKHATIFDNDFSLPSKPSHEREIENYVREQFGYKHIGEGWISEGILYDIIKRLYPKEDIIRHHRPTWLDRLELDIFLPNKKLAFEYQGIQHYQPIKHWGGEEQLKVRIEHDLRKKRLCKERGITLICIDYDEPLTEQYIKNRIRTKE